MTSEVYTGGQCQGVRYWMCVRIDWDGGFGPRVDWVTAEDIRGPVQGWRNVNGFYYAIGTNTDGTEQLKQLLTYSYGPASNPPPPPPDLGYTQGFGSPGGNNLQATFYKLLRIDGQPDNCGNTPADPNTHPGNPERHPCTIRLPLNSR